MGFQHRRPFNVTPATRAGRSLPLVPQLRVWKATTIYSGEPAAFAGIPALAAGTSNGDIRLDFKTPGNRFIERRPQGERSSLELLGDVTWTEWSKISSLPIVRTSGAASGTTLDTLTFNFEDTWRASFGVNYKYSGPWTLKARRCL